MPLQFNEGFRGSDPREPIHPAMCTDAIRLGELLLDLEATTQPEIHALVAMFCFHAARLPARLDGDGVFLPLADQDQLYARTANPIAELEVRAGHTTAAREHYLRAIDRTRSDAERIAYQRKLERLIR